MGAIVGAVAFVPASVVGFLYFKLFTREGMDAGLSMWWASHSTFPFVVATLAAFAAFLIPLWDAAGERDRHYAMYGTPEEQARNRAALAEQAAREQEQAREAAERWRQAEAIAAHRQAMRDKEDQSIASDINRLRELEALFLNAYADHAVRVNFAGNSSTEAVNAPFVEWFLAQGLARAGLLRFTSDGRIKAILGDALYLRLPFGMLQYRAPDGRFCVVTSGPNDGLPKPTVQPPLNPPR